MASRQVISKQLIQERRNYSHGFVAPAMISEDVRNLDQKLQKMGCIELQRRQIRSSDEAETLVYMHGCSSSTQQAEISTTTSSPNKKLKRNEGNQRQTSEQSNEKSVTEVVRQTIEVSNPSDVSCARCSDNWVQSASSTEPDDSSEQESIKEECLE